MQEQRAKSRERRDKKLKMRRLIRIMTALMGTALFILGLGLPGPAMATPTDFDLLPGGTLTVTPVRFAPPGWAIIRPVGSEVPIEGGQATFDPETGTLSSLSVITASQTYGLESLGLIGGDVTLPLDWAGGSLPMVGLPAADWFVTYDFDFQIEAIPGSPGDGGGPAAAMPEPTAVLLFGVGVVAVGTARKRRDTR